MSDQSNLPKKVKYGNNISEVTIRKVPCAIQKKKEGYCFQEYYSISFVELNEYETIEPALIFFKKRGTAIARTEKTVPFCFLTLEAAKNFAEYLPNMSIQGYRIIAYFEKEKLDVLYETYKITIDSLSKELYVKFTKDTEHTNSRRYNQNKSQENSNSQLTYNQYYINDLDVSKGVSSNFYNYDNLVVEYFFTNCLFTKNSIIPNAKYKNISEFKDFEDSNTHKYILMENTNEN